MRLVKPASTLVTVLAGLALVAASPVTAQETDEFPAAEPDAPLTGTTRGDGTIVLEDASFCRFLLESAFGDARLTYVGLLDRSKKQKKAREGAFEAGTNEDAVAGCVEALTAFRNEATDDDTVPGWARRSPVVPASIEQLLLPDFVAQPLAQPEAVGSAARTTGFGDQISSPFSVTGGPWLAELDATSCDRWSGTLHDARDPSRAFELLDAREYLYELEPGHYYWDVSASDCEWSVDLAPVVLGPVPTPTPEPRAVVPALHGPEWNRYPDAPNPDFLTAAQAREAVLAAGLVTGTCHQEGDNKRDRVWRQEPIAGSTVDFGSPVEVWIERGCDIYSGDRVVSE